MLKLIQKTYGFSNYQIAQLRHFFFSLSSEISKLLLIGLFFTDNLILYAWALLIFQIVRSCSGGIHCKTYWGCFIVSLGYMLLSIRVFPLLQMSKFFQMLALFICIVVTHHIGPVSSVFHPVITDLVKKQLQIKLFFLIFIYLILMYIIPKNLYIDVGYWVIILNTLQLIAAKIFRKERL